MYSTHFVFDVVENEQRTTVALVHDHIERLRAMKLEKLNVLYPERIV